MFNFIKATVKKRGGQSVLTVEVILDRIPKGIDNAVSVESLPTLLRNLADHMELERV